MEEQFVICMPMRDAEGTIAQSIESFLSQLSTKREMILLIGDDGSSDSSIDIVETFLPNPQLRLIKLNFGKVSLTRNFLNDYARVNYPSCVLLGRLDADDTIFDVHTLALIEEIYNANEFDVLICGDRQIKDGVTLDWKNRATKELLDDEYLLHRLWRMTQGDLKAELPSSNIFISPRVRIKYPNVESAEDHWFAVEILLHKDRYRIFIAEDVLYCTYSLDGKSTRINKANSTYVQSRSKLYNHFIMERKLLSKYDFT